MKKTKVLYVARGIGSPRNGPEIMANELLAALPSDRVSVSVLTDRKIKNGLPPHVNNLFYVPYPKFPIFHNLIYAFLITRKINRLIKRDNFHLVHIEAWGFFLPAPSNNEIPIAYFFRNNPYHFYVNRTGPFHATILEGIFRLLANFRAIWIIKNRPQYYFYSTCLQSTEQFLKMRVSSNRIMTIYSGTKYLERSKKSHKLPLNDLALLNHLSRQCDNHFTILSIGRICYLKNIHLLLKTLEMLRQDQVKVKLILIGDTTSLLNKHYFAKLIAQYSTVKEDLLWVRSVKNRELLKGIFRLADVLVIPSYNDAGPAVFREAIALGTPVISTPVGHALEFLDKDFLIDSNNPKSLVNVLLGLINNELTQIDHLTQKIRSKLKKWNETGLDVAKFYQSIVDQNISKPKKQF
jgi:glycosyltransferase involved in cell wall biosynthesis